MKTTIYFFIAICLHTSFSLYSFSYDSAVYAAQKGDIKSADEKFRKIVVDAPDSADVLYDAGVVAHSLNNFGQAAAYFTRAAECTKDDNLRFQAQFNAGNACVDNKNVKEALAHYDQALAIQPDNEYARHNRDRAAQMLQEQEQKNNQQNNDKNKEDQNDKKDEQNKDQQQNNDQSNDDNDNQKQNDGNDQQRNNSGQKKQNQKNDSSDNQSDEKSQGEQGDDSKQDDRNIQRNEHRNTKKHEKKSGNNKERNDEQGFDEKSKRAQEEREKQQGKQHKKTPDKQGTHDKTNVTSANKQEQGKDGMQQSAVNEVNEEGPGQSGEQKIDDPWLVHILNEQEQHDKSINKQLMQAKVRQYGGKNGQNCW